MCLLRYIHIERDFEQEGENFTKMCIIAAFRNHICRVVFTFAFLQAEYVHAQG